MTEEEFEELVITPLAEIEERMRILADRLAGEKDLVPQVRLEFNNIAARMYTFRGSLLIGGSSLLQSSHSNPGFSPE